MNTLATTDFAAFFRALHGHAPFQWQQRLVDHLVQTGRWPDRLSAPTGAGKTSAIDAHVFAVAASVNGEGARVPRRLSMVVDRRVLVDDQHHHALALCDALESAHDDPLSDPVVRRVAQSLLALRRANTEKPLLIARLRGGELPSQAWRYEPEACTIICATPDMWGSRLLLRGYGSGSRAWPVEAGLLSHDSAVIVDEAHLAHQFLATARRVRQISEIGEQIGVSPLQVVETTATPSSQASDVSELGVLDSDLAHDPVLSQRLHSTKTLTTTEIEGWPEKAAECASALAEEAIKLHERFGHGRPNAGEIPATVGCFANSVRVAIRAAHDLRRAGLEVVVVCGRLRPHDLWEFTQDDNPLLTPKGSRKVDVLVATQSLEVGVDIDLAAAVTELAPATSLVQRAGRVNRYGHREDAEFTVVRGTKPLLSSTSVATDKKRNQIASGPYSYKDLHEASQWLDQLLVNSSASPDVMRRSDPPRPAIRPLHRIELWDAWHLARTTSPLSADPNLDVWLSDDLDQNPDVGVVVRALLTGAPYADAPYLRATQVHHGEVFPAKISDVRALLGDDESSTVMYRWIENEPVFASVSDIRPGDIIIVPDHLKMVEGSPPIIAAKGKHSADDCLESAAEHRDVLDVRLSPDLMKSSGDRKRVADIVAGFEDVALDTRAGRSLLAKALNDFAPAAHAERWRRIAALLTSRRVPIPDVEVTYHGAVSDEDAATHVRQPMITITDRRRRRPDEIVENALAPERVALAKHNTDVARRVASLAGRLGLFDHIRESLVAAGENHDTGKSDPRFQSLLGNDPADDNYEVLAKSGMTSAKQIREAAAASGLPRGWRHEQLSAARQYSEATNSTDPLALRLIGTHHGHGRPTFPHTADQLVNDATNHRTAHELWSDGLWDTIVEETDMRFGVWGMAFLEAVFRAADVQISREPSTAKECEVDSGVH